MASQEWIDLDTRPSDSAPTFTWWGRTPATVEAEEVGESGSPDASGNSPDAASEAVDDAASDAASDGTSDTQPLSDTDSDNAFGAPYEAPESTAPESTTPESTTPGRAASDTSSDEANLDASTASIIDSLNEEVEKLRKDNQRLRRLNKSLLEQSNAPNDSQPLTWPAYLRHTFEDGCVSILMSIALIHAFRTLSKDTTSLWI